jgi:hypothetical protein
MAKDGIDSGGLRMQKARAMGHEPAGLGGGKHPGYKKGGTVKAKLRDGFAKGGSARRGSARTY